MVKAFVAVVAAGLILVLGAFAAVGSAPQTSVRFMVTSRPPTATPTAQPTEVAAVLVSGDVERGRLIFTQGVNGSPACSSCHSTTPGRSPFQLGPSLAGIGERAGSVIEGLSAEDYIRQSILEPTAFLVGGFRPVMPPNFAQHFNDQDIADLTAYLLTL